MRFAANSRYTYRIDIGAGGYEWYRCVRKDRWIGGQDEGACTEGTEDARGVMLFE